jgi:hypothetical protein
VIRRILLACACVAYAAPSIAQTAAAAPPVELLSRTEFHLTAEHLWGENDPRFRWEANFGGELDVVDYGVGRFTFLANYQAVLGEEYQVFDPNQGNYVLEGSLSGRLRHVELAAVLYHQSRHLGDRPKDFPVDWNMLGVRAQHGFIVAAMHVDARADLRGAIKQSHVDYRWEFDGRVRADQVITPGVGVLFGGSVRHLWVDDSHDRDGQTGFRIESGVRVDGSAGAIEFLIAAERRIDPYPLEFSTATWVTAGFRLLSR